MALALDDERKRCACPTCFRKAGKRARDDVVAPTVESPAERRVPVACLAH